MVVLVYFGYLALLALAMRAPVRNRIRVFGVSAAMMICAVFLGMPGIFPLAYVLVGYWLPASLVTQPNAAIERRLLAFDWQLFAGRLPDFVRRAPRFLIEYLELAYLCCYGVPAVGYAWLVVARGSAKAEHFWEIVLLASFLCYGLLPWIPSRAPRAIESTKLPARSAIRQWNLAILQRGSVQWNTFPSGHTAASVATALALGPDVPAGATVIGIVAASIAVGSVVGRYHYAADAVAGVLTAVFAYVMASGVHAL
jgi:hypothetical protein